MHIRDHKACLFGYLGYTYIHQQGNVPAGLCRLSRTRKDASVKEVLLVRILHKGKLEFMYLNIFFYLDISFKTKLVRYEQLAVVSLGV